MKSIAVRLALLAAGVVLGVAPMALAQDITYTSDSNIADFTGNICSFATLSNFNNGDVSSPVTPTSFELASNGFRVYGGTLTITVNDVTSGNWILASFSKPVSTIVVFPNIDHFGSAYDGYQYKIAGSNDGVTWTLLFDALTVNSANIELGGEPFVLGTSFGTAPTTVNNVLTPGAGPNGTVGYVAQFNFGEAAYRYYAFGASSEAVSAENTDQELSAVGTSQGSCQRVILNFDTTGPTTRTAAFLTNNDPNNPASHAAALSTNVITPFQVDITAHYVPTEFSPGTPGPRADGICEPGSGPPFDDDDVDCRLAAGGFVYPGTLVNPGPGDQLVPHISPLHNKMGVWYRVDTTAKATDEGGNDYVTPVYEKWGWNTNIDLAHPSEAGTPNPEYPPGWNNQNERLYDRHGDDPNNAFQFDITDYFDVTCTIFCVLPNDQGGGGHTRHFNDFLWADVPNPPPGTADKVEPLVPVPGISPFPYVSFLPMLVAFELEKESVEKSDPTALTKPHSVSVATLDPHGNPFPAPVQFPAGFPTTFTYDPRFKAYYIFLSPAPYLTDGTVYTLQISSDLFPQPVTLKFVVKNSFF